MMAPENRSAACAQKLGKKPADFDLLEINEAFSVAAIALMRVLDLDPARVNVNGGAVALGHPIGASGARVLVTLLSRDGAARTCAPAWPRLCLGGGNAVAIAVERLATMSEGDVRRAWPWSAPARWATASRRSFAAHGVAACCSSIVEDGAGAGDGGDRGDLARRRRRRARSPRPTRRPRSARIRASTEARGDHRPCRCVVEAVVEADVKAEVFRAARRSAPPQRRSSRRTRPRSRSRRSQRQTSATRQGHRHALHEPGAGDEARRGDPRPRDERRDDRARSSTARERSARCPSRRTTTPASSATAC